MDKLDNVNLENVNPKLYEKCQERSITTEEEDESFVDEYDSREVFDLIRNINDPEHPLTLEELNVVEQSKVVVHNNNNEVNVSFTPTIPHCSMATLIGLSIRVQLLRMLPTRFKDVFIMYEGLFYNLRSLYFNRDNNVKYSDLKLQNKHHGLVDVKVTPGSHTSEHAINKQLADKERVAAALENSHLLGVINQCIATTLK